MRDPYSVGLIISLITLISACSGSPSGNGSASADPNFASKTYPDYDSLSISVETFNVEALNYNGLTSGITVHLADNLNNRTVLDGTEVFFSTEGGVIDSSCTLTEGACSVTWTGVNPRPNDGRAAILIWATGTESFTDLNSNGYFDDGDNFDLTGDLPEPYRDDDHDGMRDDGEFFIDFDGDNSFDESDGLYSGVNCAHTSLCAPSQFLYIFGNATIIMSGSYAYGYILNPDNSLSFLDSPAIDLTISNAQASANFLVALVDSLDNPLPAGTTLSVESNIGDAEISPGTYGNTAFAEYFSINLTFDDPLVVGEVGTVSITAQTPDLGIASTVSVQFEVVTP